MDDLDFEQRDQDADELTGLRIDLTAIGDRQREFHRIRDLRGQHPGVELFEKAGAATRSADDVPDLMNEIKRLHRELAAVTAHLAAATWQTEISGSGVRPYELEWDRDLTARFLAAHPGVTARTRFVGTWAEVKAEDLGTAPPVPVPPARCPSCDHERHDDVEGGCWFTVVNGVVGANLVCPCSHSIAPPPTVPANPRPRRRWWPRLLGRSMTQRAGDNAVQIQIGGDRG